jgi:hypothetical protein
MNSKLFNTLLIILAISIIACLLSVALTELSSKETTLLSIVLTILSFLASWVVSNYFANTSHKKAIEEVKEQHLSNLKTYALNAAEKVNNLSNELGRLSVYLQQEIEEDDEDDSNIEELYLSAYERIESSIHIINTLKSVNDTYMSDWKGVIGEELNEKMVEQQERENELKELVEKARHIIMSKPIEEEQNQNEVQKLSKQISDLKKELNITLNSVSGTFVRTQRAATNTRKQDVSNSCPFCNNTLTYKQRGKESSYKIIECKSCGNQLVSLWNEKEGFKLHKEEILEETYNCPNCGISIKTSLSNFPQKKAICECPKCHETSQLIRFMDKFSIHTLPKIEKEPIIDSHYAEYSAENKLVIDEELLEKIKIELPDQPWQKGVHKIVAEKLSLPLPIVRNHISELIRRGIFKPQIDGVLYAPIQRNE